MAAELKAIIPKPIFDESDEVVFPCWCCGKSKITIMETLVRKILQIL